MSFSASGYVGVQQFTDIDCNATAEVLLSATAVLYGLDVDNSQNSTDVYLKIKAGASFNVGTDAPDFIFRIKAGSKRTLPVHSGAEGVSLTNGICVACVTTPGTPGTISPTNKVRARAITN